MSNTCVAKIKVIAEPTKNGVVVRFIVRPEKLATIAG